ncbi:hypothetical protein D3C76_931300 [compost metagenome]
MSLIKKLGAFVVLLVGCGYAAIAWNRHANFEKTGESLVHQLGLRIVTNLGQMNTTCRSVARIDSIAIESDGLLGMKGSAVLYISGQNDSAISIRYRMETVGDKVWVQPTDQISAQLSVMQFGLKSCN